MEVEVCVEVCVSGGGGGGVCGCVCVEVEVVYRGLHSLQPQFFRDILMFSMGDEVWLVMVKWRRGDGTILRFRGDGNDVVVVMWWVVAVVAVVVVLMVLLVWL